jgi:putative FmdB family regulatory protein
MPLYDYRCRACGDFRALRRMMESGTPVPCPECGALSERTLAAPFLAGKGPAAAGSSDQTRIPWRATCKPGCSHAHGC